MAFDTSGNLWVNEAFNNRVLEFSPPFSNAELASVDLGQTHTSRLAGYGSVYKIFMLSYKLDRSQKIRNIFNFPVFFG